MSVRVGMIVLVSPGSLKSEAESEQAQYHHEAPHILHVCVTHTTLWLRDLRRVFYFYFYEILVAAMLGTCLSS